MEGQQFKYDLHKVDSLHILNYIKEITGKNKRGEDPSAR